MNKQHVCLKINTVYRISWIVEWLDDNLLMEMSHNSTGNVRNELTDPNYPKRRLQYNIYLGKTSFFSHRSGLTRFFCHYGFVGSIEGPIWRTQIRSANAGEVDFFVFLNNMFRHFSGKLSGWVRLRANFGPKSIKLTWFFSSNAFKC
jgi:hypothetical protein